VADASAPNASDDVVPWRLEFNRYPLMCEGDAGAFRRWNTSFVRFIERTVVYVTAEKDTPSPTQR
jgi:hypothetical protein